MHDFITKYSQTGICEIDIYFVMQKWNPLWVLYEFRSDNTWRLVRYRRKDSSKTILKIGISEADARTIIEKLEMKERMMFVDTYCYRPEKDMEYLKEWRMNKFAPKTEIEKDLIENWLIP